MMNLLPAPKNESLGALLKRKYYNFSKSKKLQYRAATFLDIILILIILITGREPAQQLLTPLISPLVSSVQSIYSIATNKTTKENFAFIPGLAQNKIDDIDLNGLTYLSFFDVPLNDKGEINKDSRGYASFTSSDMSDLFDRARNSNVKILMTLSAWDEDIIKTVLDHSDVQETLANQAVEEIKSSNIDGITIDFEYPHNQGAKYQQKFSQFISLVTQKVHDSLPNAQVSVAIPSSISKSESLYDQGRLAKSSDKIFLIASDVAVPEVKNSTPTNPIYGYNENEYWTNISTRLSNALNKISQNKLVMERAWYGNGDNYPLYTPKLSHPIEATTQTASDVILDEQTLNNLVDGVPEKGKKAARANIPIIAKALKYEGILDSNVLAYALATIEHETDETFEPLEEIQGRFSARRLGYEGGMNYFGRGFIQLTHLRNYKVMGERIGMGDALVKNPELAGTPEVAAKILAAFFKENNVANLASQGSFVAARAPINPDYNGRPIARLAMKYETD